MNFVHVSGSLAAATSLIIVAVGFPAQIIRNYKRKSCEGLDPFLVYSAFAGYLMWATYGLAKPDWFIVSGDIPGCVLTFVLIVQIRIYRKRSNVITKVDPAKD